MTLATGTKFGPYEVEALIGVGGMGEVYRARDSRLGRAVALKLVSSMFTGDAERLARFEREARVLASLNHASIASIHGLEEHAGQRAIVMELVAGRELAGALPLAEALAVARQIAEGLEFAHDRGVIHRDLKPTNLRVTADGVVKILDFGLAKALAGGIEPATDTQIAVSPALSIAATQAGVLLGTAAYMAPEQAKGRPADRRADIWSFGVVLYELLTGRRLFGGETVTETLAAVLKEPIDLTALPSEVPRAIRSLLERCLERDPRRRLQSIGEARIVIEDVLAGRGTDAAPSAAAPTQSSRRRPWAIAATALLVAAIAVSWSGWRTSEREAVGREPVVGHFALEVPDGVELAQNRVNGPNFAWSPDGRYVVFVAGEAGREPGLWVRALGSLTAERLDRTDGAYFPFWSPDSERIAYFADGRLMRIARSGGAPLRIATAPNGGGGSWYRSETGEEFIVLAPEDQAEPIYRVPAAGGVATPVTQISGALRHSNPQMLPNGLLLFTATGNEIGVYAQAPGAEERTLVLAGVSRAVYSPPGYLLYVRDGVLLAQRFDLDRGQLAGDARVITDRVAASENFSAFAVAEDGIVYRSGLSGTTQGRLRWYARDGTLGEVVLDTGDYRHLEISPDGRFLAVGVGKRDGDRDLWIKDLVSGPFERLTNAPGNDTQPVWAPDSRRLAFMSGASGLYYTEVGSGQLSRLNLSGPLHSWTPDGRYLLLGGGSATGLVASPAPVARTPSPVASTAAAASEAELLPPVSYAVDHFRVSPDGRWIAYTSLETGRAEIVVAAFPSFVNRRTISLEGGTQPQWRADGKELFFHAPDERLMAVDVTANGDVLAVGAPRELFRTNPLVSSTVTFQYAATPDGQRFLLPEPIEPTATAKESLYLLTNWTSLFEAR